MFNEVYNGRLSMFDLSHILMLVVLLCITLVIVRFRNCFTNERKDKIFRFSLASISLVLEITFHIWTAITDGYSIDMLPILGLCSTVNVLTILSLFTDNKKIMSIIYYYAFTGAFFSLVFVDISYAPPHFRYFHYFIVHYNFMLASIYYVATGKITLSKKNLYISCAIIFTYSIIMLIVDIIFKQNFYYMLESPVKEVSDFFGRGWYSFLWIVAITLLIHGWHYLTLAILKLHAKFKARQEQE